MTFLWNEKIIYLFRTEIVHFEKLLFCSGSNFEKTFIISSKALLAKKKCDLIDSFQANVTHLGGRIKLLFQPPVYSVTLRLIPKQSNDLEELMSMNITVCGMIIIFVLQEWNVKHDVSKIFLQLLCFCNYRNKGQYKFCSLIQLQSAQVFY